MRFGYSRDGSVQTSRSFGFFYVKTYDENEDGEGEFFNVEIERLLSQEHGVSIFSESDYAFVIVENQELLKRDKLLLKNRENAWLVSRIRLEKKKLTEIEKKDCFYEIEAINETTLPLLDFDKILSYSYYD